MRHSDSGEKDREGRAGAGFRKAGPGILLAWTVVAAALAWLAVSQNRRIVWAAAEREAVTRVERAETLRRWVGRLGGVWVREDTGVRPDPDLAGDPDSGAVTGSGRRLTLIAPIHFQGNEGVLTGWKGAIPRLVGSGAREGRYAPRGWESRALSRLAAGARRVVVHDEKAGRILYAAPVRVGRRCVECHPGWKGREGTVVGASVLGVSVAPYRRQRWKVLLAELAAIAGGWLLGVVGLLLAGRRVRHSERLVAASAAIYSAVWRQSRDALFLLGGERIRASNPAAAELLGVDHDALAGARPWELSPPRQPDGRDSREAAEERMRAALAGRGQVFEWRLRRADGKDLDCDVALSAVELAGERFVLASVRDVSDRRQAERQRRLLESAVENAAESVMVTDPDGTILYVNPAFERITGYAEREAVGRNPRILKSGVHDEAFYRELWETITTGGVWRGTFTNRRKDGELYQEEAVISPVTDDRGAITAFVAVQRDVTRERRLEERLQLAQRMETVGQMAGVVAHDFNNLLMAIQGAAEVIDRAAGDRHTTQVRAIRHAVERGADLIKRLLTVAKRQTVEPEHVDLSRVLRGVEPTVRAALPENVRCEIGVPEAALVCRIDPGQLEQVVLNLAANARDAMPNGGELLIDLDPVELSDEYVGGHPWATEGRFARLSVTDTGTGMDHETMARIFEPFFSTKGEHGTGLGLATVYGIVEGAGGFVNVYSELGRGTTFKVYLPLVDREPTPPGKSLVEENEAPTGSGTVLLVEDDPGVREGVRGMLEALGYAVLEAETGEEALEVVRRDPAAVDVVLTDVVLPGISGGELAERVREAAPGIRFIFSSGYTENVVHHRFVLRDDITYLEKPYTFAQLARTLAEVLQTPG